jgi:hypothetical protein
VTWTKWTGTVEARLKNLGGAFANGRIARAFLLSALVAGYGMIQAMPVSAQGAMNRPDWEQSTLGKVTAGTEQHRHLATLMEGLHAFDATRITTLDRAVIDQILKGGWRQPYPDIQASLMSQVQSMAKIGSAVSQPVFAFPVLVGPEAAPFLKLHTLGVACCLAAELQAYSSKHPEAVRWVSFPLMLGSHLAASASTALSGGAVGLVMVDRAQSTIHRLASSGAIPVQDLRSLTGLLAGADSLVQKGKTAEAPLELRRLRTLAQIRLAHAAILWTLGQEKEAAQIQDPFSGKPLLRNGQHHYSVGPDRDDDGGTKPMPGDVQPASDGDIFLPSAKLPG